MFLLLFLSLNRSEIPSYCTGNLTLPEPAPNMSLIHVSVLTRHGQRPPTVAYLDSKYSGHWTCDDDDAITPRTEAAPSVFYRYYKRLIDRDSLDYPSSCRSGDLTLFGQKQHVELGSFYRDHYVNKLKFLPEKMDPELFRFYSSDVDRSFKSAESFLVGLYPVTSDNEVLTIRTGAKLNNALRPNPDQCPILKEISKNFYSSKEFEEYAEKGWVYLSEIAEKLHIEKSAKNIHNICSGIIPFLCSENELPSFVTQEAYDWCWEQAGYTQYHVYYANRTVPGSAIWRQLIAGIDDGVQKGIKFVLQSAHDNTITSALIFLNYTEKYNPPYASHLNMEVYSDSSSQKFIRLSLNGKVVRSTLFDEQEFVGLDKFTSRIMDLAVHCPDIKPFGF